MNLSFNLKWQSIVRSPYLYLTVLLSFCHISSFAQSYDCNYHPSLQVGLIIDSTLCPGSGGCINSTVVGGSGNPPLYLWSDGSTNNNLCNLSAGTYTVTVIDTFYSPLPIYKEDFDSTHNWAINISTGNNGWESDEWKIDSAQKSQAPGECISLYNNSTFPVPLSSNKVLYVTDHDNHGGIGAITHGSGSPSHRTEKGATSPIFSSVGQNDLSLEFNYIVGSDSHGDTASIWYNDGIGWSLLSYFNVFDPCPTSSTSWHTQWRRFNMSLPPSCNNNPNLQIGFHWKNYAPPNIIALGLHVAFAVDSILINSQSNYTICSTSASITIPPPINSTPDSINSPYCNGSNDGFIQLNSNGGYPPYRYLWDNGTTNQSLGWLLPGTYMVTTTDSHGCTTVNTVTLTEQNTNVINIVADSSQNSSCTYTPDGNFHITANGGTPAYTFLWNNGATTTDIFNVPSGNYTVTITDQDNCYNILQTTVNADVTLLITDTITMPRCHNENGIVLLNTSGGNSPYQYNWGSASSVTTNSALLPAGNYTITVSDLGGSGCLGIHTITLIAPPPITISLADSMHIGCNDTTDVGSIRVSSMGGTGNYSYNWSNNLTTTMITGLGAGNYTVTVTDDNGCTINSSPYPILKATPINVTMNTIIGILNCNLDPIGVLQANAIGGNTIRYLWNNNLSTSSITNLNSGNYTVTATNEFGCMDTISQQIIKPTIPKLNAYTDVIGEDTSYIILGNSASLNAGSIGLNYSWTGIPTTGGSLPNINAPNQGSTTASPTPNGIYTYIVTATATTDTITCVAKDSVWVIVQEPFEGIPNAFTPNKDGTNEVFKPLTLRADEVKLFRIYNRWGQEVYNGDASVQGWNGQFKGVPQPTEVYIYRLSYQRKSAKRPTHIKGEVVLIR